MWGFPLEVGPKEETVHSQNTFLSLALQSKLPKLLHLAAEPHEEKGKKKKIKNLKCKT